MTAVSADDGERVTLATCTDLACSIQVGTTDYAYGFVQGQRA